MGSDSSGSCMNHSCDRNVELLDSELRERLTVVEDRMFLFSCCAPGILQRVGLKTNSQIQKSVIVYGAHDTSHCISHRYGDAEKFQAGAEH
ncbi:hypothetical protein C0J45_19622 [Silurus meridionalis]|nr:hypothetical protein C0J45_19622 [Silurus meridionalis]